MLGELIWTGIVFAGAFWAGGKYKGSYKDLWHAVRHWNA
jgi:hypothetical protein